MMAPGDICRAVGLAVSEVGLLSGLSEQHHSTARMRVVRAVLLYPYPTFVLIAMP